MDIVGTYPLIDENYLLWEQILIVGITKEKHSLWKRWLTTYKKAKLWN